MNLNSNVAQVVIGVRRSGKSTICQKAILESGLPFGYVNFDDERLGELTASDSRSEITDDIYLERGNAVIGAICYYYEW